MNLFALLSCVPGFLSGIDKFAFCLCFTKSKEGDIDTSKTNQNQLLTAFQSRNLERNMRKAVIQLMPLLIEVMSHVDPMGHSESVGERAKKALSKEDHALDHDVVDIVHAVEIVHPDVHAEDHEDEAALAEIEATFMLPIHSRDLDSELGGGVAQYLGDVAQNLGGDGPP